MMLGSACLALCAVLIAGDVSVPITQHWQGGFQGKACLPVDKEMHSWKIRLVFDQPITTLEAWTADVVEQSADNTEFVLGNKQWNGDEHSGDQLCVEFQGHGTGDIQPVVTGYFEGTPGNHTTHSPPATGGTGAQGTTPAGTTPVPGTGAQGTTPAGTIPVPVKTPMGDGVATTLTVMNDWGERFQGAWNFQLTEDAIGWMVNMTFSSPVIKMDISDGQEVSHTPDNLNWVMVDKPERAYVPKGTFSLRFYGTRGSPGDGKLTGQAVFVNLGVDRTGHIDSLPNKAGSKYNYDDVLMKSIMFYEAQRSGKLPANNRIPWRGDSALGDKGTNGEDLTGGWYDAGDHVKFNYPMAYTSVILSWGLMEFKDAYEAAGQLQWVKDSIRWPLEYLIKCHVSENELYIQVGDGARDHSYWGRPEEMTMPRPAYKIDASTPGCDVAMETAAAFAAGAMVFNETDSVFANNLLAHAKTLWQFALDHRGKYSDSVPAAKAFYPSFNYTDEMCWGSMWLYKATGDDKYLTEAKKWFDPAADWAMSWDDKVVANQLLLFEATGEDVYKQAVIGTFTDWFPGGSITYTPKGLAWRLQWAPLRYSSNMAMMALLAAKEGIHTEEYRHWAMCQIHYALGDTGFSYVVGFGDSFPHMAHHRGASCPNPPAPCGPQIMSSNEPNVHILYGALVGGPDKGDMYKDERSNYVMNEVACDYNSGFQTAVAGLRSLLIAGEHPEQTGHATCPYTSA
ncbi:hypothetical protein V1264_007060 [Littorina saxatilis]|uniref:Endoglucanase n=1 Tax=Littorina saxatilis TaxID=31220 RepID=A0AAN9AVF2_9CAEN